jgi:hypothetical protein
VCAAGQSGWAATEETVCDTPAALTVLYDVAERAAPRWQGPRLSHPRGGMANRWPVSVFADLIRSSVGAPFLLQYRVSTCNLSRVFQFQVSTEVDPLAVTRGPITLRPGSRLLVGP